MLLDVVRIKQLAGHLGHI